MSGRNKAAWGAGLGLLAVLGLSCVSPAAETGLGQFLVQHQVALPSAGAEAVLPPGFLAQAGPRLYLLGEEHGVAANNDADFSLLQALHRTAGVRTYLCEVSYAQSWYLNRYLDKGDASLLDLIFTQLRGRTVDASREKRAFWEKVRAWNRTLPAAERIAIVGVDLERFPGISLAFLRQELGPPVATASWTTIAQEVAARRPVWLAILGAERLEGVEAAVRNLRDHERAARFRGPAFDEVRDRALFTNFQTQAGRFRPGSVYGRMGFAHIAQHSYDGSHWLSYYLNRRPSAWAGRVVGIWPLYAHARRLALTNGIYSTVDCAEELGSPLRFAAVAQSELTLFQLVGPGSPYAQRLILPAQAEGGVTTDYFQYVLLFKNTGAAQPWNGPLTPR